MDHKMRTMLNTVQFTLALTTANEFQYTIIKCYNKLIQENCTASVTNCSLGLETATAPTVNMGWQLFTNDKNSRNLSANYFILHLD